MDEFLHVDMLEAGQPCHLYNRFLCEAVLKRWSLLSIRIDCIILLTVCVFLQRQDLNFIIMIIVNNEDLALMFC